MEQEISRESIMKMEPGCEMDAFIAEKVMGWKVTLGPWSGAEYWEDANLGVPYEVAKFKPSTDIAAAWEVFEIMKSRGYLNAIKNLVGGKYEASFLDWDGKCSTFSCISDTAPEAICKAALLTTLEESNHDNSTL